MAKQSRHTKVIQNHQNANLEHTEVYDDSPLPNSEEVAKLHSIDQSILPWLKERAEQEQKFRHTVSFQRVEIIDNNSRRNHNTTRLALVVYLFLMSGCMFCSFYLLLHDKNIQGSIFGGLGLVMALGVLLARRTEDKKEEDKIPKK